MHEVAHTFDFSSPEHVERFYRATQFEDDDVKKTVVGLMRLCRPRNSFWTSPHFEDASLAAVKFKPASSVVYQPSPTPTPSHPLSVDSEAPLTPDSPRLHDETTVGAWGSSKNGSLKGREVVRLGGGCFLVCFNNTSCSVMELLCLFSEISKYFQVVSFIVFGTTKC